jgi:serine/threonine protein kinase
MNPEYKEYRFPKIRPLPWEKVFRHSTPREAVDFVSRLLQYEPQLRPSPLSALLDSYFDELRDQNTRLPNGQPLPELFNFTQDEYD